MAQTYKKVVRRPLIFKEVCSHANDKFQEKNHNSLFKGYYKPWVFDVSGVHIMPHLLEEQKTCVLYQSSYENYQKQVIWEV